MEKAKLTKRFKFSHSKLCREICTQENWLKREIKELNRFVLRFVWVEIEQLRCTFFWRNFQFSSENVLWFSLAFSYYCLFIMYSITMYDDMYAFILSALLNVSVQVKKNINEWRFLEDRIFYSTCTIIYSSHRIWAMFWNRFSVK